MTKWEAIEVERVGRVSVIRFNRPEKLNAFNEIMSSEFRAAIEEANEDPEPHRNMGGCHWS